MMKRNARPQPKHPELDPSELAALRDIANQRQAHSHLIDKLREIGLVEVNAGTWAPTQQGKIQLMFASAR